MVISIYVEKAFNKIQHPSMILKNSPENGYKGNIPQHKVQIDKSTTNITLSSKKSKAFPPRSGTRQGPSLATFIYHSIGSPSHSRQEREIKGIQIGKEEVKLPLFTEDIIVYIKKNPKDATKNLLELISKVSKAWAYQTQLRIDLQGDPAEQH